MCIHHHTLECNGIELLNLKTVLTNESVIKSKKTDSIRMILWRILVHNGVIEWLVSNIMLLIYICFALTSHFIWKSILNRAGFNQKSKNNWIPRGIFKITFIQIRYNTCLFNFQSTDTNNYSDYSKISLSEEINMHVVKIPNKMKQSKTGAEVSEVLSKIIIWKSQKYVGLPIINRTELTNGDFCKTQGFSPSAINVVEKSITMT